jgi:hypothetical protein
MDANIMSAKEMKYNKEKKTTSRERTVVSRKERKSHSLGREVDGERRRNTKKNYIHFTIFLLLFIHNLLLFTSRSWA